MTVRLLTGDCRELMATLEADSIDAVVCDPPYELNFMGRAWDRAGVAFDPDTWRAVLRVMKPGAHLFAMGGSRTEHRMTCAIEDAGFEIRDKLCWLHATGFPKSLDISKAIDKQRHDDVTQVTAFLRHHAADTTRKTMVQALGFPGTEGTHGVASFVSDDPAKARVPTWDQWVKLRELLSFDDEMDAEVWRLNGRKGEPGEAWFERPKSNLDPPGMQKSWTDGRGWNGNVARGGDPITEDAAKWDGWGSALKPSMELIVLARKPLSEKTIAANVLRHGCGGLNIDGCRIGTESITINTWDDGAKPFGGGAGHTFTSRISQGRWPANVLLDETAAAALDQMSGERPSSEILADGRKWYPGKVDNFFPGKGYGKSSGYGDAGGASRFFFTAKASTAERNKGLEGLPESDNKLENYRLVKNNPNTGKPNNTTATANHHPTVKPLSLMSWLVRLITPPGGTVLDPFCGSGSTLVAADRQGFDAIGIDLSPEYVEISRRRVVGDAPMFATVVDQP